MKRLVKRVKNIFINATKMKVSNSFESMDKMEDYIFTITRDFYVIRKYFS